VENDYWDKFTLDRESLGVRGQRAHTVSRGGVPIETQVAEHRTIMAYVEDGENE
jgi:hypothetical protein